MLKSLTDFLHPSKKTVLLVIIVAATSIALVTVISSLLSRFTNLHVPSLGTIKAIGVEAYWDRDLQNKTESLMWSTIWPGSSQNVTVYLRSIGNTETTLRLNTANWYPANISKYMTLSWNYNGTTLKPGDTIPVTLTLSAPYSTDFVRFLVTNDVEQFSFDIIISTSEYH